MTLPVCTTGQLPYELYGVSSGTVFATGRTPGEACVTWQQAQIQVGYQEIVWADTGTCQIAQRNVTPNVYTSRAIRQACTEFDESNPIALTVAEGASITGAILLVWAAAWAFRVLIRTLNVDEKPSTSESET